MKDDSTDDPYSEDTRDELVEDSEISPEEEGFLAGYEEEEDKEEKKGVEEEEEEPTEE